MLKNIKVNYKQKNRLEKNRQVDIVSIANDNIWDILVYYILMKAIKHLIISIVINGVLLYLIAEYVPSL